MMKFLRKLATLRAQIYVSCSVMVALCAVNVVIGWWGQKSLLDNIASYESTQHTLSLVLQIDSETQELKACAEEYLQTGSESRHRAAIELESQLITEIAVVQERTHNDELVQILDEMKLHMQRFQSQLRLAAAERSLRSTLVIEQLPEKGQQVQDVVSELHAMLKNEEQGFSIKADDRLLAAVQAFGNSRSHLLQYFSNPHYEDFQIFLKHIRLAQDLADELFNESQTDRLKEASERFSHLLHEYSQLGSRAVHATRGYMFYANVVMAGEISEFVHYSNKLKSFVGEQRAQNLNLRQRSVAWTRDLWMAASVVAILSAIGLAAGLSYSIISPIARITETFRQLANDVPVDSVPATDRQDEIGRMAQAATVFREKNRETSRLLQHSQELSAELSKKAQTLESTITELDNFAYVASHDLKSPLRGINSLARWVQEDCQGVLPGDSQKHLQQMQDRVHKMEMLLNDLLDYSRVGRTKVTFETVDVGEMVQSTVEIIDNPHGVKVIQSNDFPVFKTARAPLQQVLLNLLTNAIKYNDKGENGRVDVSCVEQGDFYAFDITDNGIGIEPKFHARIFQMYQRVALGSIEGTGMGLAIVKKQIKSYGGTITVRSTLGQGASFHFTWPKTVTSDAQAEPMAAGTAMA